MVPWSSQATFVILADWMSSDRKGKLGSFSSTLIKRCCLSDSHLEHRNNQRLLVFHFFIPIALSTHYFFLGYTPLSASFNLDRSSSIDLSASSGISQDSSPSLSNTYHQNHLHTQNSTRRVWVYCQGPQPNHSPHTCTWHSSTFPWVVPLRLQPDWHSYSHSNQRFQNKLSTSSSTGLFLVPSELHKPISVSNAMMVSLIRKNPMPERNAPYSGCPAHRHYFHLYKKRCPGCNM